MLKIEEWTQVICTCSVRSRFRLHRVSPPYKWYTHTCRQKTVVKIIYLFTPFGLMLTLGSKWSAICLELHVGLQAKATRLVRGH